MVLYKIAKANNVYFVSSRPAKLSTTMALQKLWSSGQKQWCNRSSNTCCSKKILLLQVWQVLFTFSWILLIETKVVSLNFTFISISNYFSLFLAPFIGWLADVKFGRYAVVKFGLLLSFLASVFYFLALVVVEYGFSTLCNIFLSAALFITNFGFSCYLAAMLPFLTDQLIGATSDELSAVVQWNYWAQNLGYGLSNALLHLNTENIFITSGYGVVGIFAISLALIIISDCLCQQWLDRTHKVTNPIKLIVQVLNYSRKHSYPERRSAFTYIDEEQPKRIDFGKKKFGGPFFEEEVEDVKTVLRLIPLVVTISLCIGALSYSPVKVFKPGENINNVINTALKSWLLSLLLIPGFQILSPFLRRCIPKMLKTLGAGLLLQMLGYALLDAAGLWGVMLSNNTLSCTSVSESNPDSLVPWYWKLAPCIMYSIGRTMTEVLLVQFVIAQSPDKMKGLVIGILITSRGIFFLIIKETSHFEFTLCYDISICIVFVALFIIFLLASKCYTLRERNREINIQAIVEEHYERYLDQEEEYMRQCRDHA